MSKSSIEWTESTWNPVAGCTLLSVAVRTAAPCAWTPPGGYGPEDRVDRPSRLPPSFETHTVDRFLINLRDATAHAWRFRPGGFDP
jgi:hypothetical protein